MNLETRMIRTIWTLVETSNPYSLIKLSDSELIQKLLAEVERVSSLNSHESKIISQYIGSRTVLIRDLAYAKVD
ncbi:hypothetical protein [Pleurocapsa sp. PCC 7319]|uniref:hypothetical protein n=1 Tax=Pleurocapsa sp. PCC 7319 TaxID=118161 RepID=UPI0004763A0B|nr:hypothetical protein [Pleurocapsa sp. PCC 7319]